MTPDPSDDSIETPKVERRKNGDYASLEEWYHAEPRQKESTPPPDADADEAPPRPKNPADETSLIDQVLERPQRANQPRGISPFDPEPPPRPLPGPAAPSDPEAP